MSGWVPGHNLKPIWSTFFQGVCILWYLKGGMVPICAHQWRLRANGRREELLHYRLILLANLRTQGSQDLIGNTSMHAQTTKKQVCEQTTHFFKVQKRQWLDFFFLFAELVALLNLCRQIALWLILLLVRWSHFTFPPHGNASVTSFGKYDSFSTPSVHFSPYCGQCWTETKSGWDQAPCLACLQCVIWHMLGLRVPSWLCAAYRCLSQNLKKKALLITIWSAAIHPCQLVKSLKTLTAI